jgi:hypothetical protein
MHDLRAGSKKGFTDDERRASKGEQSVAHTIGGGLLPPIGEMRSHASAD